MLFNENSSRVKLYKAGKKWVTALLISGSLAGVGIIGSQINPQVNAATPQAKQTVSNASQQNPRLTQFNKDLNNSIGSPAGGAGGHGSEPLTLPTADGLGTKTSHQDLNVRYAANSIPGNYSVYYSVGNKPSTFNAPGLSKQSPYATYQLKTFSNQDQASKYVKSINSSGSGSTVNLGHGIKGTKGGAAGSQYTNWNQQGYNLQTRQSNVSSNGGYSGIDKGTAGLLTQNKLPQLQKEINGNGSNGAVNFDTTDTTQKGKLGQKIVFQQGSQVYQITAHDPVTAIKMATSVKA